MLVRLKGAAGNNGSSELFYRFNSMLVRLKVDDQCLQSAGDRRFQFHAGSIKRPDLGKILRYASISGRHERHPTPL